MDYILRNRKKVSPNNNIKKQKDVNDKWNNEKHVNERLEHEKVLGEKSDEPDLQKDSEDISSGQKATSETKNVNYQSNCSFANELPEGLEGTEFVVRIKFDLMTISLFAIAFATRIYKLSEPKNIVFDEVHYGRYVSLYMKNIFFFDQHPPLGKQLIAGFAMTAGYDGNFTFPRIGSSYSNKVPIFWLRFVPALCGSLLAPCIYKLLLQLKCSRWTAVLGGFLVILDNSLLTQSRFILLESMLLLFSLLGLLFLLKFTQNKSFYPKWWLNGFLSATFFTCALSVKYSGFYSYILATWLLGRHLWELLPNNKISNIYILFKFISQSFLFVIVPIGIYIGIFYLHLNTLHKAGPHDSVMTSAFQASLDGGLASITKGQPLQVVHGSQITLRHTHGRRCWLHSHAHVYPVRYPDKRGSSHQQQVTCYSFKDVNNWWIVKRPETKNLVVSETPDIIKDGDVIQLVHGITARALNSHDVAAPVSPHCQEVTCYIDYNVSMSAQILWKVDIINKDKEGAAWHAITSQVRLIHLNTGYALRFSGRQLPDWGFNQHEIVSDKVILQQDTVWNVEEHRYTKSSDQKERERQLINAEMIPTAQIKLSFWHKFLELQSKMLFHTDKLQNHLYSSEPLEWPLMSKGIAYWIADDTNAQIHLLGNAMIWYSATLSILVYTALLLFYLLRRRRLHYDLNEDEWKNFKFAGEFLLAGYFIHYLPYFFVERTLFLHHYLPALMYKILLLCYLVEHIQLVLKKAFKLMLIHRMYNALVIVWLISIIYIYIKFTVLCYGTTKLSVDDIISLRWRDTWDFILHKE